VKALDGAAFRRANFVLHFHGFDNQEALAGFDFVSRLDEEADDFTGHGGDDLLAALGFEGTMAPAAPGPRIGNLGGELLHGSLEREQTVWRPRDADFVRLAIEKKRERIGVDFDGVGMEWLAVQGDSPAVSIAFEFNGAEVFAG